MDRITIFDTTLRDGEQSPGHSMNLEEKLHFAWQLERLHVDVIEAGFPIASEGDFAAVRKIAEEVRTPIIAGLSRACYADIERAAQALERAARPRIHTFVATSDVHLVHKLRKSREEVLEMAVRAVEQARRYVDDVEFSAEDAGRTDLEYLCQVIAAAVAAGASTVNIPDTVGYCLPQEYGAKIRHIRQTVPGIERVVISTHCHNDLGLAVANSLAGVENGARQVECTVNGIGERAGNAALEEIAMAVYVRQREIQLSTGIDSKEIYRTSELLANITGKPVQANKAVVGKNAFAHEAGIHQDGVLKDASTYEIMTPETVGVPQRNLVLGKHSGRNALAHRYQELGYTLGREQLDKAYVLFTKLADKKKVIYDEDLIVIVRDGLRMVPEAYSLRHFQIVGGPNATTTVAITLERDGRRYSELALGDGPVDATVIAVDTITGYAGRVLDYTARAVTHGQEAVGEVFLHAEFEGKSFVGKAASTDLNLAGARAYINAVNKALWERQRFQREARRRAASQ
jgi:2-isopropylmalate synthase